MSTTTLALVPIDLALDKHYFEQQGLKPQPVHLAGGNSVVSALESGSVTFAVGVGSSLVLAASKGVKGLTCVANLVGKNAFEIALRTPVANRLHLSAGMPLKTRLRMLKGLKLGVSSMGSATALIMRLALKDAGLKPTDAKFVALGGVGPRLAAIEHGQVDVIDSSPPALEELEASHSAKLLFRASALPLTSDMVQDCLMVSNKTIQTDPGLILKVMRAIDMGTMFVKQHTNQAIQTLKQNQFKHLASGLLSKAVKGQLSIWPAHLAFTKSTWPDTVKILQLGGQLKGPAPNLSSIWTDRFIKQLQSGG